VTPGRPRKGRTRAPDESRDPKNPHRKRKFGLRGKCGYCKMLGHNSRTCPRKKQPATEVELPTPPPASVSLLPNCIVVVVDAYMVWITYLWHFFFFIMVGFSPRVKDAAVVSGGAQIQRRTVKGEVHSHITKE
jgi:hypothetical protein